MTQIACDSFVDPATDTFLDEFGVRAVNIYKISSVHNTYGRVGHSREIWHYVVQKLEDLASLNPQKIPILYGTESHHGANYVINATLFPQQIGLAATFNTTHAEVSANVSAYETRAASIPWAFAPVVDLGIDPRWSRVWENFGEDPYLGGEMGAALVRGLQGPARDSIGPNHIGACAKHYVGYGSPVSGKDRTSANIPELYLREYHLPAFQRVVEAGCLTVMLNSALTNRIPVHADKFIVTELLKGELKFQGFVVTDWQDIENLCTRDRIVPTVKDAIRISINAGVDMSMVPYDFTFCDLLIELILEGAVSMERIDDAVRRVLRVKTRLGLWERPVTDPADYPMFGGTEFSRHAYNAAADSITLLKNERSVLPIPKGSRVLVVGPNSDSMRTLNGGWSYSWQGEKTPLFTGQFHTIRRAIEHINGMDRTLWEQAVVYDDAYQKYWIDHIVGIDAAVAKAASVDYIVLCVGENSYCETPGDLQDLTLSQNQIQLAEAMIRTGKTVILVLNEGRPRLINQIVDRIPAIVQLYLPSNRGGDAFADILFGDVNPSGKLPYTYPRYAGSITPYFHKYCEHLKPSVGVPDLGSDYNPLWEFGHGLSYTTFEYSNLTLSKTVLTGENDRVNVSVIVKNTGNRPGKEAVLLFTSDLYASVAPDLRRLRRFTKIELEPGESRTVRFANLGAFELSFINYALQRVTEPGDFVISVAGLKVTLRYR